MSEYVTKVINYDMQLLKYASTSDVFFDAIYYKIGLRYR